MRIKRSILKPGKYFSVIGILHFIKIEYFICIFYYVKVIKFLSSDILSLISGNIFTNGQPSGYYMREYLID